MLDPTIHNLNLVAFEQLKLSVENLNKLRYHKLKKSEVIGVAQAQALASIALTLIKLSQK